MEIWELVLKSNVINFIVMIIIFVIVAKKLNFAQKLDDAILKIKKSIDDSELAKNNSQKELEEASEQTKNIKIEIEDIENKASENILNIKDRISKETQNRLDYINENASKIIGAKEKEIISALSKKTVLASIEAAGQHIINLLRNHPDYHEKFIQESIEELDRLK